MSKTITRREAAKAVAIGSVAALVAPAALAASNPDADLVRLEVDFLAALRAACDVGTRVDEYDVHPEIKFGPRIQVGEYNGHPRYATDDESVEAKIQEWVASADEAERRDAERDEQSREILNCALEIARKRGHLGKILSPDEKRQRALSYRPAWQQIKEAHAIAIAQTDLPRLRAEHDAAWERVREIEELFVSTPAHGMTGVAVKIRYLESELRSFEYDEGAMTGRVLASLMRDLRADSLPEV